MKKTKMIYIIAAIVGCVVLGVFVFLNNPQTQKVQIGMEIWDILQPVLEAENQSMKIDASIHLDEEEFELKSKMYRVTDEADNYLILEQDDFPVFIVDNLLLLENGKAFKLSEEPHISQEDTEEETPKTDKLFEQVLKALKEFELTTNTVGGQTQYRVVVTGKMVANILKEVLPTEQELVASVNSLQMVLVTKNDKIVRMELSSDTSVDGKKIKMDVVLSELKILKQGEYSIPDAVKKSIKEANQEELICLSKDLYPLLKASKSFETLADRDGKVRVGIDFGLIQLDTTLDIDELRKGTDKVENSSEVQEVPNWVSVLFLEGDISISNESQRYTYMLELDAETTRKLAEMLVPNLRTYQFEFTKSEAKLVVQEDEIASIGITINGTVDMFIKEIPLKLEMEYMFE